MSEQTDFLLEGLLEAEDASGATIIFAGQSYPCAGGAEFGGKTIEAGGFRMKAEVTIAVRTAVFDGGPLPKEKQTIQYSSAPDVPPRRLRIDSLTPWQGQVLILDCNDPNRGA